MIKANAINEKFILLALLALFIFICGPLFVNNLPYLDDYYLIAMQRQDGFWAPTKSFQAMWGSYRLIYTTLMAPLYALGEHFWLARSLGLTFHIGSAVLVFIITKKLKWDITSRLISVALFLYFPYSLEAIAWPSNIIQYPLAPFMALLGATLTLIKPNNITNIIIGGALMGLAVWIHEQTGPLVILMLLLLLIGLDKKTRLILGLVTLLVISANFVLIFLTRASNVRLSGSSGAKINNLIENIHYIPELLRTTPAGDLYYSTSDISYSYPTICAIIIGLAIATSLRCSDKNLKLNTRDKSPEDPACWRRPIKYTQFLACFVLMGIGAYLVSISPILLSPIPWHTARVVYIPFLIFTLTIGFLIELVLRLKGVAHDLIRIFLIGLTIGVVAWGAEALKAEVRAYDLQLHANFHKADTLARLIEDDILEGETVVIIGGYPANDNDRPLFGEHFISMTQGEIKAALDVNVQQVSGYPHIISASGWDHLCETQDGGIKLKTYTGNEALTVKDSRGKSIIFALWDKKGWKINRNTSPTVKSLTHKPPTLSKCP